MLYSEIIAVCSQIHTKHINTLFEQNIEFFNFEGGGIYSNHWALNGFEMNTWYFGLGHTELWTKFCMEIDVRLL
jgi:hypothetical protein